MTFRLPEHACSETFLAASGPGGQNVNKVATACQLRVAVFRLGLDPAVYQRLKSLAGSKLTQDGELIITARRYRSQEGNREDARARAQALIAKAHERPRRRIKTKVSRAAKGRRVDAKKKRATIKSGRGKVRLD
ncbi:MAG: aminoacyl-tRNA hydrolase [Sphingomonadales bacterium]|nr:aminoacyl-tRNA hydrolase [Sphingomonadales bacterium]